MIQTVQKEIKDFARQNNLKLKDAREMVAQKRGYKSWGAYLAFLESHLVNQV